MINTKPTTRAALAALVLAGVGACASGESSFPDQIERIADDWRDGKEDVEKGRDMVEDGRDDVKKAQRRLDGERDQLRRAEREDAAAKAVYNQALGVSDAATVAMALDDKNSELSRLKKRSEDAADEVKDARDDVEDAQDDIRKARRKIERGEERMRKGQRQMEDAEVAYRQTGGRDDGFFDSLF